ncbi:GNAT family N-acetyltransferase [Butyrivibrio sp. YAB3001]|uniref:GNAT family N-acetyltransferase n=1 Tax=Butyrivibrio sp. YAB3001 TaxID=1520812 RepID=UPI0008F66E9C|nr:GNAT family protein [Butyrivibrio sp. YAB3001]SFC74658.1 diamine N-acetyltransferase [Butyrivibrio sp. YAB3001]
MVTLRELKEKDAPLMLEWMHDKDIQKGFKKNMNGQTLDNAVRFCKAEKIPDNISSGQSVHFAIVDENDEYLGTISLKEIDLENENAEYAIVLRKKAQGNGIATEATRLVLDAAFKKYCLHRVYLTVLADNKSAIKLYERCGFKLEGEFREHLKINGKYVNWKWYGILRQDFQ